MARQCNWLTQVLYDDEINIGRERRVTSEIRPDAVVVPTQQIIEQVRDVLMVVPLRFDVATSCFCHDRHYHHHDVDDMFGQRCMEHAGPLQNNLFRFCDLNLIRG